MQVYSSLSQSYIALVPVLLFCLGASFTPAHSINLIILTIIFSVGVNEQSYYNMAISLLLGAICITQNIESMYIALRKHLDMNLYKSLGNIFKDLQVYLLIVQAIALVVVCVQSFRKYHKFKSETLQNSSQWS